MPYITQERKDAHSCDDTCSETIEGPGELTYLMQRLVSRYLDQEAGRWDKLSYKTLAEVLGAIEGLRIDLDHRVVIPYEQQKCHENGDVW